jgi:hypothetical protein
VILKFRERFKKSAMNMRVKSVVIFWYFLSYIFAWNEWIYETQWDADSDLGASASELNWKSIWGDKPSPGAVNMTNAPR